MEYFKNKYLTGSDLSVLDVGSRDTLGSYRGLFKGFSYTGLDIIDGNNVDYVPDNPYRWDSMADNQFDAVISGQAFEHIEFPDRTIVEIDRVLKPGGYCCIIAPSTGCIHEEPDYRRYNEQAYSDLLKDTQLTIIENYRIISDEWNDAICIARKNGVS